MSKRITEYSQNTIKTAVALLDISAVIGVPTETVYGLIGKYNDREAIDRIYTLKGRDPSKPLALLVSSLEEAEKYGIFNEVAKKLAKAFWPGPLTLVVPSRENRADWIGIRIARNNFLNDVLSLLEAPVVATSINFSNEKSAVKYEDIPEFFLQNIDAFFDIYDTTPSAVSSIVVKINDDSYEVLRNSSILTDKIQALLNE
jgi:L-threonylcarbamoyladenylate synthase